MQRFSKLQSKNIIVNILLQEWKATREEDSIFSKDPSESKDGSICPSLHPGSFGKNCDYQLPAGETIEQTLVVATDNQTEEFTRSENRLQLSSLSSMLSTEAKRHVSLDSHWETQAESVEMLLIISSLGCHNPIPFCVFHLWRFNKLFLLSISIRSMIKTSIVLERWINEISFDIIPNLLCPSTQTSTPYFFHSWKEQYRCPNRSDNQLCCSR